MILIHQEIRDADQEGLDQFGNDYQLVMERVPRANALPGLILLIRNKVTDSV
jgi:hypothetical protein